ncbi:MAG: hypothetical protein RL211_878 [Pseudomonadota bacterium]|jgi:uncharacterized protein (DUF1800 family)
MLQDVIEEPATAVAATSQTETRALESSSVLGASLITAAALTACGGGASAGDEAGVSNDPVAGRTVVLSAGTTLFPTAVTDEEAARFLLQAQFSASDAEIASVRSLGFKIWLERQMAMPGPTGWDWLNNKGYADVTNPAKYYDNSYPADYMIWSQLMTAPDAMRKRVALALSEFFVVSVNSLDLSWRSHAIAHYWDLLNTHAFGNYRDLLEAITLNPAMGHFLNTKGNQRENSAGRQPDENFAREVMQLFSLGLNLLNIDGTVQTVGGVSQNSYTESDVSNLARIFTGYDVDMRQNTNTNLGGRNIPNTTYVRLPMRMIVSRHSVLAVTFLGTTIPQRASSTTGNATEDVAKAALKTALDTIFNHPNVGPFFCKQMIQRLVTSNPSPAYVARVATVFNNNGSGVRGDLAYVFAAILMDDEARGPTGLSSPEYGKLREPIVRLAQWGRTFGITSTNGGWQIPDQSQAGTNLGQSPLRSPSVFNFFRPGYVPSSTTLTAGVVVPEFQLLNESSTGGYLNFIMSTISAGIGPNNPRDMRAGYAAELALVTDATALVQRVCLLLSAGQVSAANQLAIVNALNNTPVTAASSSSTKLNRVYAAVLMVMACAQYLIQK